MKKIVLAAAFTAFAAASAFAEDIKIGVTPGPHAQIMENVKKIAETKGLNLEILEFSDYVVPNQALADGELQANSFQHKPYLDNQVADRKYDLISVGYTVNFPMGVYSKKVKNLSELKDGSTVAIPNDPTNGGRALLILADQGLIKLNAEKGLKVGPADVTENPKKLEFAELDAAQLPRSLADVDAAVINTNYAVEGGLDPSKDPIAKEGEKAPYINIIAINGKDKDAAWVKTLLDSYHSPENRQFVLDTFKGVVIPSW